MVLTDGDLLSFGALITYFRTRRHLTQQQLAAAVGVHRHAIGRWERGDYLPASKTMVLELARHLTLDDQETRHLLDASLTALAPHWSVPFLRNPFFTGRDVILERLHTQLGAHNVVARTQSSALRGLGGVGKTQIALEYAYRHALEYRAVFWIGAETAEHIISSLLRIADVLQLAGRDGKDHQRVVAAVQQWLTTQSRWLLIWDNLEDIDLLPRFLPAARAGAVLLTTRRQSLGTLTRGMDLLPMEHEEGVLFLLRRAKVVEPEAKHEHVQQLAVQIPAQFAAAGQLVAAMGGLPLALDQAGAYIEEAQCNLLAYAELFHARRAVLLQQRGEESREHPESVSTTFTLAITATAGRHPAVGDLLCVCAFLQSEAIPEELFRQGAKYLGARLEVICCDELEWNRLVTIASSYSLLHRQPQDQTLSVHRLVQAVLIDTMTEEERERWLQRAIEALDMVFPVVQPSTEHTVWGQCERLLPHTLLCMQRIGDTSETLTLASLAYKVALYLHVRGHYTEAEPLLQRALSIREHILGPEHPDVATSLNNLAIVYWTQGKYMETGPLLQRALSIREHILGPEHPDVATSLNNLANLYWTQGKYVEAEPLLLRALHISEQALGPEHPDVARPLNNLASLYWNWGKYIEVEPLLLRALSILEHALGPEHSAVARPLNSLANLYWTQGKYVEAEPLLLRALSILEQTLGPDHSDLAHPFNNLGGLYVEQGKCAEAEPLLQRALYISEQALGPEHPDVARPLNSLANLHVEQGNYTRAELLFQRALSIRERHLGQQHPETAETLYDLAIFRQKQSKLSEALSLAECALQIRSQTLGDAHPTTVSTQTLYTLLIQEQRCIEEKASTELRAERNAGAPRKEEPANRAAGRDAPTRRQVGQLGQIGSSPVNAHLRLSSLSREMKTASVQQTGSRTPSGPPDQLPMYIMSVGVRGNSEQVAYTRTVKMREVTFTCTICGQTVTQWHYPSGRIKYCSYECKAVGAASIHEKRVAKQREKRRGVHKTSP